MTILKEHGITSAIQRYNMTQGNSVSKVSDHIGEVITVKAYVLYEDDQAGKLVKVLAIQTDDGDYMASSGYCVRTFEAILECFGEDLPRLLIGQRRSANGRNFCFFDPQE